MRQETNRVNLVTDKYLEIIIKKAWFIGCAQGTDGDFKKCYETLNKMDWSRLSFDIKKVE